MVGIKEYYPVACADRDNTMRVRFELGAQPARLRGCHEPPTSMPVVRFIVRRD